MLLAMSCLKEGELKATLEHLGIVEDLLQERDISLASVEVTPLASPPPPAHRH